MHQLFAPMTGVLRLCQIAAGETQNRDVTMESRSNSMAVRGNTDGWESATQGSRSYPVGVDPIQLEKCDPFSGVYC